ncbi:hypothetical protein [Tunturiibacter gelidoferens]|uniref:Nuclear transport factor 2 family protein n=1 Tax=Tunturiibacter lichenicola TaxID=2051959 RepID=A0A7Y9T1M8_9BACT|nr:hypothetical protein [Edaphobacter lichenicola]NYF50217.1 hypothetical protein [Edaphobacter lichenicola]
MKNIDKEVEDFLKRFQINANVGSAEEIVEQFADVFMSADPSGARAVPSSKLLMAIPLRKKLFEGVGGGATALVSVEQTMLDNRYVLLKTEWQMKLDRGSGPGDGLTLRSTFVLYRSDDGLKIVFYLNHEDLMSLLRERGSLPPDKT